MTWYGDGLSERPHPELRSLWAEYPLFGRPSAHRGGKAALTDNREAAALQHAERPAVRLGDVGTERSQGDVTQKGGERGGRPLRPQRPRPMASAQDFRSAERMPGPHPLEPICQAVAVQRERLRNSNHTRRLTAPAKPQSIRVSRLDRGIAALLSTDRATSSELGPQ